MKKLLIILFIVALSFPAISATVDLSWDQSNEATGYKIFKRVDGQVYDYNAPAWTGTGTRTIITDLNYSTEYFFVIRAFNYCGNESEDSVEISHVTEGMCGDVIQVTGGNVNSIIIIK